MVGCGKIGRDWTFGAEEDIWAAQIFHLGAVLILLLPHLRALWPNTGMWAMEMVMDCSTPTSLLPPSSTNPLSSSKVLAHVVCSAVSGGDAAKAAMLCIVLRLAREHTCLQKAGHGEVCTK